MLTTLGFLVLLGQAAPPFTSELWRAIAPIYETTLKHPFLAGLTDGTLPRSRFQFYLAQDALYLKVFGQALHALAAKAPREEWAITLGTHAIDALKAERELHETVLASYGVSKTDIALAVMAPANYAYTNHLLVSVERGSFAEGLAAMLPCYWIYWEVGKTLKKRGSPRQEFQRWIDQYSSEEYGKSVNEVLAIMNTVASGLDSLARASLLRRFIVSARYEYLFWDMAWREERWFPEGAPQ